MLLKIITPLPSYKLLDYSYGFEIEGEVFYIRTPTVGFPDKTQLFYADKEIMTVYPVCSIFGTVINFPIFELDKEVKSSIQYNNDNTVKFTIPYKVRNLTGLPNELVLRYIINDIDETFNEFFKIIATHFSLFKNYEKDIQKQISALLPVYSDYLFDNLLSRINKFTINDYIKVIKLNIQNIEYSILYYVDDSVYSIETRNYHQKCLDSLKSILNHLRNNLCALSV